MTLNNNGSFIINNGTATEKQYVAQSIKVTFESVLSPDSGYTDDGEYHPIFIVKNRRRLEITMPTFKVSSSGTDMSDLIKSIQGKTYTITYYDFVEKGSKTINVYTDTSAADVYNGVLFSNGVWEGLSFVATELKGEVA